MKWGVKASTLQHLHILLRVTVQKVTMSASAGDRAVMNAVFSGVSALTSVVN